MLKKEKNGAFYTEFTKKYLENLFLHNANTIFPVENMLFL